MPKKQEQIDALKIELADLKKLLLAGCHHNHGCCGVIHYYYPTYSSYPYTVTTSATSNLGGTGSTNVIC
jgi:hypothetical protein